ncbi:MAG: Terminase-like family protein, partial [Clostridia bacterium]|nr:Terminase-like family protein [Clostridia bacterium]
VIDPFEIPADWTVYRSFDFGYSKPFSCDWWAVDYEGRAYLILQLYGCTGTPNEGVKWDPDKIFAAVHRIEKEHRWLSGKKIYGVADPSIWDASRGDAIIEAADRNFVFFQPGDNKRIPGWMQCHYRLSFDGEGKPMVYFFNTCKDAVRTLPLLTYSDTVPEDLDTSQEDHFADSFRYFCMSRPIKPTVRDSTESVQDDPLDLLNDNKKYKQYSY